VASGHSFVSGSVNICCSSEVMLTLSMLMDVEGLGFRVQVFGFRVKV
jgi:hypothetical protein